MKLKLERLHEYVLPAVATLAGMGFAVYCGKLTGKGQMGILSTVLTVSVVFTMLLIMRQMIWLWIPLTWSLVGSIAVLPLPFSVRDLVVASVFICFLVLKALKVIRRKIQFTGTDLLLGLMLFYLVTVFIRNPVGVQALGSEKVGGRPYFNVAIACVAYWILAQASMTAWQAKVMPLFIAFGQTIEGILNLLASKFPQLTPVITTFYTGVSTEEYDAQDVLRGTMSQGTGRRSYFGAFGMALSSLLTAFYRPLTLINPINILRFSLFCGALVMVGLSGFRSLMVLVLASFAINSYVRRGWSDVTRAGMVAVPVLALLISLQGIAFQLPLAIQRTLSFLPGRWDYVAIADAKGSSQWRFEMWEQMLFTDKYIENKWLGDGFGFTRRQFDVMRAISNSYAAQTIADSQETFMITGGVHSGPISAIRFVGYVGLGIYLFVLGFVARDAWALIRRARNTTFFSVSLFLGIQMVWEPINYVFVFGGYEGSLPQVLYWVGLLKMLKNSMDDADATSREAAIQDPLPENGRFRRLQPALAGRSRIGGI